MKIYKHVIAVILIYLLFSFVGIGLFVFFTSSVPEEFAFYATVQNLRSLTCIS